ncbi:MAG: VOC family protein [Pirellulaceae bacterium]|jgi:catechol 2,3-dioxygenase-like lactoylglutathione lyase family enzyme|nr:VOC family protein [Pirellulaceae bacterium]
MRANEILETCLYVDNLDAAQRFYAQVLGLELFERYEGRHLFWRCGQRMLLLFLADRSGAADSSLPPHGSRGAGHLAFAVPEAELAPWQQHLTACGVTIEQIITWPQGGQSLYFRDPAGNSLELTTPRIWGIREQCAMFEGDGDLPETGPDGE